jgi:hypothetical protein
MGITKHFVQGKSESKSGAVNEIKGKNGKNMADDRNGK